MTKILSFVLMIFCFACKGQNTNDDSRAMSLDVKTELIGAWNSDMSDAITKANAGEVTMTFTSDGNLIYDIHTGSKIQRMKLTYRVDGDTIISDQPSHPQQQRTRFRFENKDRLILEFEGVKTVFVRKSH